ncbi:MAG: DUF2059 domain-containing protein [Neisseria sp.]|nr:DUF2059 domain-containing protein [Neisseria sp.]
MLKKTLLSIALSASCAFAFAQTPSEASIKHLFKLQKISETMSEAGASAARLSIVEELKPLSKELKLNPAEEQELLQITNEWAENVLNKMFHGNNEFNRELISGLVDVYRETYTQQEINAFIAFYSSPEGQSIIGKQKQIAQKTEGVLQKLMPNLERFIKEDQADLMNKVKPFIEKVAEKREK